MNEDILLGMVVITDSQMSSNPMVHGQMSKPLVAPIAPVIRNDERSARQCRWNPSWQSQSPHAISALISHAFDPKDKYSILYQPTKPDKFHAAKMRVDVIPHHILLLK